MIDLKSMVCFYQLSNVNEIIIKVELDNLHTCTLPPFFIDKCHSHLITVINILPIGSEVGY